jgi:calcium-dependent protein kinase
LEKSIFSFISNQVLNSKDIKKLKEMFKTLDKDGSGTLTIAELNSGYDSLGLPPPASIVELMKKLDTDDSGSIDYYEFLKGSEDWTKLSMKKDMDFAARKYEKGSGAKLSLDELKATIPDIQGTDWYTWLTQADQNGDGYITLDELKKYLSEKLGI